MSYFSRQVLCFALVYLTANSPSFSQPAKWTVESVIKQERVREVAISSDGKQVLWVKRTSDFDKDEALTDVYLTVVDEDPQGEPRTIRLTRTGNNTNPSWSPDSKWIAFESTRSDTADSGPTQVWLMNPLGGEPERLTDFPTGINDYRWLKDDAIAFTAREGKTEYERALKKRNDDALVVEDTTLFWPVRLFSIDINDRTVQRLTRNSRQIGEFAVSRDGSHIVYALNESPVTADSRTPPTQHLLDVESNHSQEIFNEPFFSPSGFQWTLGGSGFYAGELYASDPENRWSGIVKLYYFDLDSRSHHEVPLDWEWGVGEGGYAVTSSGIHVQLANGPYVEPRHYVRAGNTWSVQEINDYRLSHSSSFTIGPDGSSVVFDYSRPDTIPQYLLARHEGDRLSDVRSLMSINSYLSELPLARAEVVEWEGYGGATINGILYYPHNYETNRSYPLIVSIRGGPAGVDLDAWQEDWSHYPNLLAQRGAFVLRPNYHGSSHHGLAFVESIKGRYYELELPDIVSGVEHLVSEGLVDPDSLGVIGWSNGAILAIGLTVEYPEMFKVAAPGAGDVNWISDYGNCAFGVSFNNWYFRGPPWEYAEHYVEKSPLFRLTEVVTPTLITFGDADTAVPTEQGWQHYRALQQIGKAPVRFVLFPDQPHSLLRMSHQKRKMEEELAWIDEHLFGTYSFAESVGMRALSDSSPLNLLTRRSEIAVTNGRYGIMHNRTLVPETVEIADTLEVGRFEVTRAQFQAFRSSYAIAPGQENFPVTRITHGDARAYVQWLSRQTGRSYRLPSRTEAESLRKLAGKSENNLTYWAGYHPTPEEARVLQEKLRRFQEDEIILPVGSKPPANTGNPGQPLLFDLDGNVAEWATGENGEGVIVGGSAFSVYDDRSVEQIDPPGGFVGFRVIVE